MRRITAALAASASVALGAACTEASAADIDYSQVARNIIPSGQQGSFPVPQGATAQAQMYNALTPLFDHVTNRSLFSDFKSEQFGQGTDGPGTIESVPFAGVRIMRAASTCPTSPPQPTPAASGPRAGLPRRTGGSCSRRHVTTPVWRPSTPPG